MSADNVHATKGERMYDTGSTTFMLICTMLVFLMTPGLAFFYGGLSRRKNVINTMLMCFGAIGLVGVLWIVAGWSLAYGGHAGRGLCRAMGSALTGLFCVPELSWTGKGGLFYTGDVSLLVSQVLGIVVTVVIVLMLDLVIAAVVKALFHGSLRVDEADEALGLDASQHGESAYPSFSGLD